jgi:formylglycine-generating enzyme required for sulfatase activity
VVEQGGDEQGTSIQLKVGSVLIKSLPVECTVTLDRASGGGWDPIGRVDKTKPEARVSNLEIGTYRVTASRANGTLSKTFEVIESDEVTVFFNFVGKSVEVTSAAAEARRAEEARRVEEARLVEAGIKYANENSTVVDLGSGVSMRLIEIQPGRFMMGSPASEAGRNDDEPQHSVTITKAFWLGQTEVTQAQWQAVMGSNPSHSQGNPNHPVEQVSWNDAQEFCRRLSQKTGLTFRLPTEAEWEYACRAGTTTAYSFGNDAGRLGEYAWFKENSGGSTKPVATRKPNAWGLHDMHGNVWEWCSDWYGEYPSGAATDPQGPRSGSGRVLRGGSWSRYSDCRAANRNGNVPGSRNSLYGFRVARTP